MTMSKAKAPWDMSNSERLSELWSLLYRAEEILESFSVKDYKKIDTGATYCLPKCIRWGMQCVSELKGVVTDETMDHQADQRD